MLYRFEPNVKATITLLKLLNVKVNNFTVDETLQNHPDWPSLLSISDALSKWNIPNAAGKIEKQDIERIPTPFLVQTFNPISPIEVITDVNETFVKVLSKDFVKPVPERREDFFKRWNGIYLLAEKAGISGEVNFKENNQKRNFKVLMQAMLVLIIFIISILFIERNIFSSTQVVSQYGIYIQYLILISGMGVSSLLLWHEIDSNNPILKKVCTGIIKGNCDAILSGKQSKVLSWLSWSEVGFFYFTGGLLTFLFVVPMPQGISILAYINILALPYTIFSIYYQGFIAKQWCVLCLSVQALLILGGINVFANGFLLPISQISIKLILTSVLFYLIPVLIWYSIKPYLLRLQEAKNTKNEYLRLKFNTEIFETLLKKQKQITIPTDGLGINMGNPSATNILVKVCSPYCGPCATAHPKIEELLSEIPDLAVKIIFTAPNDPTNHLYKPVSHFLAIQAQNNEEESIKKALDDWYLADKKDYTHFAKLYPSTIGVEEQGNTIEAMDKWCTDMEIQYTPTIFINGFELPNSYSIEDLQYFLREQ
jgi:thiol-disulfide isomerase/thioredoxin